MGPVGQARGDAGRPASRAGAAAAIVAGGVALLTVVGTAAATADPAPGVAAERGLPVTLVVVVLTGPVLAAVAAWRVRTDRPHVALGLALAGISSAMPLWAGWPALPDVVRAGVLAVPAVAVAGTAQVALLWSPAQPRPLRLRATHALAVAAVAVHLAGYDPISDLSCARTCAALSPLLGSVLPSRVAVMLAGALTLAAAVVAVTAVTSLRTSRVPTSVRAAAGLSLAALGTVVILRAAASGGSDLQGILVLLLPATVLPVAASVALAAFRTARVRADLARVIHHLALPPGTSVGRSPVLGEVHFAVTGEGRRWVDAMGREVDVQLPEGAVVLRDATGPAIRLVPAARIDDDAVRDGLTPARRLAMDNARLTALTRAHLADLRASQRRVVARADAERRRIERDLHDGVQQRLVSAALHLSAARRRAGTVPGAQLATVDLDLGRALEDLRRISHGVFPEGLLDEGLGVALDELVRESDRETTLEISADLPTRTEISTAVYATVRAVLDSGGGTGAAIVRVDAVDNRLTTTVELSGPRDPGGADVLQDVADRVGAVGGSFERSWADGMTTVTAVIPCGW